MSTPRTDLALSVGLLALGGAVILETRRIPAPIFETFGARPIPLAVATLLIVLAGVLLVRSLVRLRKANGVPSGGAYRASYRRPALVVLLLAAHALAVGSLGAGYIGATALLVTLLVVAIEGVRIRTVAFGAVLGAVLSAGTYLAFTRVLFLDLAP